MSLASCHKWFWICVIIKGCKSSQPKNIKPFTGRFPPPSSLKRLFILKYPVSTTHRIYWDSGNLWTHRPSSDDDLLSGIMTAAQRRSKMLWRQTLSLFLTLTMTRTAMCVTPKQKLKDSLVRTCRRGNSWLLCPDSLTGAAVCAADVPVWQ